MEEFLHQLISSLSVYPIIYLQDFIHPRWLAGFLPSTVWLSYKQHKGRLAGFAFPFLSCPKEALITSCTHLSHLLPQKCFGFTKETCFFKLTCIWCWYEFSNVGPRHPWRPSKCSCDLEMMQCAECVECHTKCFWLWYWERGRRSTSF